MGNAPLTPALLRLDPMFDPLRNDPRFQKLVASPAPQATLRSIRSTTGTATIATLDFRVPIANGASVVCSQRLLQWQVVRY